MLSAMVKTQLDNDWPPDDDIDPPRDQSVDEPGTFAERAGGDEVAPSCKPSRLHVHSGNLVDPHAILFPHLHQMYTIMQHDIMELFGG